MTILELLKVRDELQDKVIKIIGYGSSDDSPIEFEEGYWILDGDELLILEKDEEPNNSYDEGMYYGFTVSSYSSKGEKLYIGEQDGYTFVMAYPMDDRYDNTTIFMLNNKYRHKI